MEADIDLTADLNAQDDDGLGWSTLADARDASRVRIGSMLLAGNRYGQAVVRVMAVDWLATFTPFCQIAEPRLPAVKIHASGAVVNVSPAMESRFAPELPP